MIRDDFDFITQLLKKRSGLSLGKEKIYLLESRLLPVARSFGFQDLRALITALRKRNDEKIVEQVVDAMTTNESMFFRDHKPFEQLKSVVLPRLKKLREPSLIRIWSAACSHGQEAYSVAMCLQEEQARMAMYTYEIFATDISKRVLHKAEQGIYSQFEIQRGLPVQLMLKYFRQLEGNQWQANEALRRMITFRQQNLLQDISALGKFDLILCRNVFMYFEEATKRDILERFSHMLTEGGVLMMGGTETIMGLSDKFQPLDNERGLHIKV